jgi:hypothetical protein
MIRKSAAWMVALGVGLGVAAPIAAYADSADTKVPMQQVPEAVRQTVQQRAQGADIKEVARLSDDGKLFTAEIKKKDTTEYLYIEQSGKVVGEHVSK